MSDIEKEKGLTWKAHNIERNDCPMRNVNRKFTATVSPCPALRVSSGWISLGSSQPCACSQPLHDERKWLYPSCRRGAHPERPRQHSRTGVIV